MDGLASIGCNSGDELLKQGGEGSLEHNLKSLITDEAYSQLSQKFPNIIPLIVGVNILEKIDDNTTIGGAIISNGNSKLIIPVIYVNGKVDATTFIYSEENDTMLSLTKSVIAYIVSSPDSISGTSYKPSSSNVSFDAGDINKLFVPPKTYNPKIASSGGMLFAILEKVSCVRDKMLNSLKSPSFRERFNTIYGEGASSYVENMGLSKTAHFTDNTPPEALFSISEVASSDWEKKNIAAREFAENGFVISHGYHSQLHRLEKTASISTKLKEITGDDALESINLRRAGVYNAFNIKDLEPVEIIVSSRLGSDSNKSPVVLPMMPFLADIGMEKGNTIIGKKIDISHSTMLEPFSTLSPKENKVDIIFILNGEIIGSQTFCPRDAEFEDGLGTTVITNSFGYPISSFKIERNSSALPIIHGTVIYAGDNNVKIVRGGKNKPRTLVTTGSLDTPSGIHHDIVKVAFDGADYIYKNHAYQIEGMVHRLLEEGYEKQGIYSLIKTATSSGSAEFTALSAKLDILAKVVTNLAGKIQSQQQSLVQINTAVEQATLGASVDKQEQPAPGGQEPQPVEQAPIQQGTQMPDPYSGIPTQEQEAQAQAQQQQTAQSDRRLLGQEEIPVPGNEDTSAQEATEEKQTGLIDGMNPSLDPQILSVLSELKDSQAMDVGVVSMLANSETIGGIVHDYRGDILSGASAIGRILLNFLVKKNDLVKDIGDKKYNQTVKTLKIIFTKTSDLYVDIVKLGLEDDGKVGS